MRVILLIGYLLLAGFLSLLAGMWLHNAANAHLADRPDLNEWAAGLASSDGHMCCDGSDAEPIKDVDWEVSKEGHYRVRIDGRWTDVPDTAVVPGPNKYGVALVWGYPSLGNPETFNVRCFMPAGGV